MLFSFSASLAQEWTLAAQKAWQTAQRASRTLGSRGAYVCALKEARRAEGVEAAFSRQQNAWLYKSYPSRVEFPGGKTGAYMLSNGWTILSNKMNIVQRIWWEYRANLLLKNKNKLLAGAKMQPLGTPEDWVSLIPPDRKIIFLGEYHNKNIQYRVEDFLKAYRKKYPTVPVILLTEFLPDSYPFFLAPSGKAHPYLRYFENFLEMHDIHFAGLEEPSFLLDRTHVPVSGRVGSSSAGRAARNNHWAKRIGQWRKKYPQAVFFIYAGGGHVGYEYPGAVSQYFKDAFVLSFVPLPERFEPELFYSREIFHAFTQGQFFRQGVLYWQNPRLGRLAGFDAQILLRPEYLER